MNKTILAPGLMAVLLMAAVLALSTSLANAVPIADADGPYTVNEGSVFTLDGSGSTASTGIIVLYEWDLDNDGTYDAIGQTVNYSFPDGPSSWVVTLRVTDDSGSTDTDTGSVDVLNVAPTIDPIAGFFIQSTTLIDVSASFNDPAGSLDASYLYAFDWGDGSPVTTGSIGSVSPVSASHIYGGSVGTMFTGRVMITDKDGGTGEGIFNVHIVPEPATLTLLGLGLAVLAAARRRKQ